MKKLLIIAVLITISVIITKKIVSNEKYLESKELVNLTNSRVKEWTYNSANKTHVAIVSYASETILVELKYEDKLKLEKEGKILIEKRKLDLELENKYNSTGIILLVVWAACIIISLCVLIGARNFFELISHIDI